MRDAGHESGPALDVVRNSVLAIVVAPAANRAVVGERARVVAACADGHRVAPAARAADGRHRLRGYAYDGLGQGLAASGAMEWGGAERKDPAIGRHEPIPGSRGNGSLPTIGRASETD